jgi:peptidoglycan/LPS O-acetylase OafA/YrhL
MLLFIAGFMVRLYCWHYLVEPRIGTDGMRPLWNKYVYYPTYNRLDGLLVGLSIAGLFTFYPKVKSWANRNTLLLMLLGIGTLIGAYFVCIPKEGYYATLYGFTLVSVGYGFIVAAAVCPANFLYRMKSKITALIATLSYSIYLVHKIVIHITQVLLEKTGMDKNSGLMMICCLLTTIAAALLMRYLVEKPALRLRNRVLSNIKKKKEIPATALSVD